MFSWIVLLISIALLVIAIGTGAKTYSWAKGAQAVDGTVVELVEKRKKRKKGGSKVSYRPRVRYEINGEKKEVVSSQSSNPPQYKVGEAVKVAANPEKGDESIATFGELYGFSVVLGCLGAALAVGTSISMNGEKVLRFLHPHLDA